MRPKEVCCLCLCLPVLPVCVQLVIFHFPDLIPKRLYPCIFGRGLRFASPHEAFEIPSASYFK